MIEEKQGILAEIIFYNKENGYLIATVENASEQELFTAVGCLPGAERGREFVFQGKWKTHPVYGEQFAFSSYREELPKTASGIEGFLSSGLMRGVGKKTASAIVRHFKEDTLRIIEEEPDRLTEVDGIGQVKAAAVAEAFQSHREFAKVVLYVQNFGISTGYAMKLYKVYGPDTIRAIEENPYQLVDDVFGIGFRIADKIAERIGVNPHDPNRVKSGILYSLWNAVNEGHTFVPQKLLCENAGQLLDIGTEEIYETLIQMTFEGDIQMESLEGRAVVYLLPFYLAEQRVTKKLLELERGKLKAVNQDMDELIDLTERQSGIELSENQRHAIKLSFQSGVSVITGGPGTGKTTILKAILTILQSSGFAVAVAAPTGRAAKRITETTGFAASTIHRLLDYYYSEGEDSMCFGKNEEDPLTFDAILIDEASMIDILLMKGLLDAIPVGTRLILVGDADQLPSVGPGNVLRDILVSEIIPSVRLSEIFRQAKESLIVVNAHKINRGEYPDCNEKDKDFFLLRRKTELEMLETIKDLCTRRLPSYFDQFDPIRDVQVLTPVRKGVLGSIRLNQELQAILNPPKEGLMEKRFGERLFREGDKVMQIKNNYQLGWKRLDDFTDGQGVFNGDSGLIQTVDPTFNEITVLYDDNKFVKYDPTNLEELELAYAITVHKSQGSEFPVAVMPVSWFPPMLATRNLLYTAVTRAKDAVILVGSEEKMQGMVDNNRIVERYSGLGVKLRGWISP